MTKESVVRMLRTEVAAALADIMLALRAWRVRATVVLGHRLRQRDPDRLSDHMLKDVGLSRSEGRKAVDWLSRR